MKITVLRLGHRKNRDIRVTTHCCLVARAFLADELILSGEYDPAIIETVRKVTLNWGGKLPIRHEPNWKKVLRLRKKAGALLIHLTMYGQSLAQKLPEIQKIAKRKHIIVIIGAQKVPTDVYKLSDFNVAVTNQPHSEVAALAIFLNELLSRAPLQLQAQSRFKNAKISISPGEKATRIKGKHANIASKMA